MFHLIAILQLVQGLDESNQFDGDWKVMSIIKGLDSNTEFVPAYIDDIRGGSNSMLDLFIFEPFRNIGWIESVRGTSFALRPSEIPNSAGKLSRISYWNDDEYPDLLQLSNDGKELRVFVNKIVYGRKKLEHERVAHPGEVIHVDFWESQLVYYTKEVAIIDYIEVDINDDGVDDLILVTEASNGSTFMNLIVFDDATKQKYTQSQIGTSTSTVARIFGYFDYNDDGSKDFIYLDTSGELSLLVNLDPIYRPIQIWDQKLTDLSFFEIQDLNADGRPDFVIFDTGRILLLLNEAQLSVAEVGQGTDAVLFATDLATPFNFMVTWTGGIYWISQTFIPHPENADNSDYIYTWVTLDGANFAYQKHIINLEEEHNWNHVATGYDEDEMIIFLQSESQIYIAWMPTTSNTPYGWSPNFWVYLMGFVIGFSILGGMLHVFLTIKDKEERLRLASIQGLQNDPNRKQIIRKITV